MDSVNFMHVKTNTSKEDGKTKEPHVTNTLDAWRKVGQ